MTTGRKAILIALLVPVLIAATLGVIYNMYSESINAWIAREASRPSQLDNLEPEKLFWKGRGLPERKTEFAVSRLEKDKAISLLTRVRLLGFFDVHKETSPETKAQHQKLVLWFIDRFPAARFTGSEHLRLDPELDGEKYDEAKELWATQVEKDPDNWFVRGNAASFAIHEDLSAAETTYKKIIEIIEAQDRADMEKDDTVVANIKEVVAEIEEETFEGEITKIVEDDDGGETIYVTFKAQMKRDQLTPKSVDPNKPYWLKRLANLNTIKMRQASSDADKQAAGEQCLAYYDQALKLLTKDVDKMHLLRDVPNLAFETGDMERATTYCEDLLELAMGNKDKDKEDNKSNWDYANAVHRANVILGRIALKAGDTDKAAEHLEKAAKAILPSIVQEKATMMGFDTSLAKELMKTDKKDSVMKFLVICEKIAEEYEYEYGELKTLIAELKADGVPLYEITEEDYKEEKEEEEEQAAEEAAEEEE